MIGDLVIKKNRGGLFALSAESEAGIFIICVTYLFIKFIERLFFKGAVATATHM